MAVEEHKFADVLPCLAPQRHAAWMAVDAVARDVQAPLGDLFNEIDASFSAWCTTSLIPSAFPTTMR